MSGDTLDVERLALWAIAATAFLMMAACLHAARRFPSASILMRPWTAAYALLGAGTLVAALDLLAEPWRTAVPYLGWLPGVLLILAGSRRLADRPVSPWVLLPGGLVLLAVLGALSWSAEWDRWRILLMQSVIFAVGLDGLRGAVLAHARQRPVPLLLVAGSVTMVAAAAMRIGVTLANPEATYAFLAGMVSAAQKGYLLAWLATLVLLGAGAWQAARRGPTVP